MLFPVIVIYFWSSTTTLWPRSHTVHLLLHMHVRSV